MRGPTFRLGGGITTSVSALLIVAFAVFFSPSVSAPASTPGSLSSQAQDLLDKTTAWQERTGSGWDKLAAKALRTLVKDVLENGWPSEHCTLDDVYVRREWGDLSKRERREYIDAVLCMKTRPSQLDPAKYPGARNRYDDFVAVHIDQTLTIHATGNFLTWHRYFTWAYEWTLRTECGYKGYHPYINWGKYVDPYNTVLFDGSDTSMSGDGVFVEHDPVAIPTPQQPDIIFPPQKGGGCIHNGPFVNWTANLGPVAPILSYVEPNPQPNGLGYNPRCLRRDLNPWIGSRWSKDSDIVEAIVNYDNIVSFQRRCQGDFVNGYMGVHAAGHYLIGGDPGGDFFASPGDPYFFLHHAAIDRFWWTWQNLMPQSRTYLVGDTITFNNTPPSRDALLDDPVELGVVGTAGVHTIRSLSSAIGGEGSPFCYIYA